MTSKGCIDAYFKRPRPHNKEKNVEKATIFLRLGLPSTLIRHQNAALFLRLGLPSTLIRHQNDLQTGKI